MNYWNYTKHFIFVCLFDYLFVNVFSSNLKIGTSDRNVHWKLLVPSINLNKVLFNCCHWNKLIMIWNLFHVSSIHIQDLRNKTCLLAVHSMYILHVYPSNKLSGESQNFDLGLKIKHVIMCLDKRKWSNLNQMIIHLSSFLLWKKMFFFQCRHL